MRLSCKRYLQYRFNKSLIKQMAKFVILGMKRLQISQEVMNPPRQNKSVNLLNKRKSSLEPCGSEKVNLDLEAQALLLLSKLYNSLKSKRKRNKKGQSALES